MISLRLYITHFTLQGLVRGRDFKHVKRVYFHFKDFGTTGSGQNLLFVWKTQKSKATLTTKQRHVSSSTAFCKRWNRQTSGMKVVLLLPNTMGKLILDWRPSKTSPKSPILNSHLAKGEKKNSFRSFRWDAESIDTKSPDKRFVLAVRRGRRLPRKPCFHGNKARRQANPSTDYTINVLMSRGPFVW